MLKTSTKQTRLSMNGPTMGTRWSASFYAPDGLDAEAVRQALQAAVNEVDTQMSTWNPNSDLMRLNAGRVGVWVSVPPCLVEVLRLAFDIGRASGGAFDVGVGAAVRAWGFGPEAVDEARIRKALEMPHPPAHEIVDLDVDGGRVRRLVPVDLDLNGIAKGYGVDRLAEVLHGFGIASGLVGIDGEMRAFGLHPAGEPWMIAVEAPDPDRRAPHSILALQDAAVATSGDYRRWLLVGGRRLSHTMDPRSGAPLPAPPASVTVIARTCTEADAWATALMVLGPKAGTDLAERICLDVLFLLHDAEKTIRPKTVGSVFYLSRKHEGTQ